MRPIRGLERPLVQWTFVAASVVLTVLAAAEAIMLWRARTANEALHATALEARLERDRIERTLARERSAREALSLELARRGGAAAAVVPATLTLEPIRARGTKPPQPTIDLAAPDRVVELRLRLPAAPDRRLTSYAVAMRQWSTGQVVWSRSGLSARTIDGQPYVSAMLTGDVLAPGAYELALTGIGGDGATVEVASYDAGVHDARR